VFGSGLTPALSGGVSGIESTRRQERQTRAEFDLIKVLSNFTQYYE